VHLMVGCAGILFDKLHWGQFNGALLRLVFAVERIRGLAMKRKNALDKAWEAAEREFRHVSVDEMVELAKSSEAEKRLLALALMKKQIMLGGDPRDYFELARKLVKDNDNNCRWQSLFVIADLIEFESELVWEVICEFGDSPDDDMRSAIACVCLEHLLDYDFDRYFPKVKAEIRKKRYRFINTLEICSFDGMDGANYKKAQNYVRNAKRGLSETQWGG